jgi:O-antigen ligase
MLTPRSAAAHRVVSTQRLGADALDANVRVWGEAAIAFLPFAAWLLAGISDSPKLAAAAYVVVAAMLAVRPRLGYLALLPLLMFFHGVGFPPLGPMFILAGIALGSALVRCSLGMLAVPRSVRPALWCSLAFLALTAFQLVLGLRELGGTIPLNALSQYDQIFIILSVFAVGLIVLPGRSLAPYYLAFLVPLVIVAAVAIINFVGPGLLKVLGLAWIVAPGAYENRASGIIASPNSLGLALACGLSWIIVMAAWNFAYGRHLERVTWLLSTVPVAGIALLLTFSRAAILALGAGLIAAVARRSLRAAGVLAVGAVIAVVLIYPLFVEVRLGQTFGRASPAGEAALDESDRLRSLMAKAAVKAFIDAPIAGHGFATFSEISPRYSGQSVLTSAHNMYLKVAAEQGVIGLAVLAALFISIVVPMWRAGLGPWIASLAVFGVFAVFSFTGDSFGNAQTVSTAFVLIAAGVAQAGFTRDQDLANRDDREADSRAPGSPMFGRSR